LVTRGRGSSRARWLLRGGMVSLAAAAGLTLITGGVAGASVKPTITRTDATFVVPMTGKKFPHRPPIGSTWMLKLEDLTTKHEVGTVTYTTTLAQPTATLDIPVPSVSGCYFQVDVRVTPPGVTVTPKSGTFYSDVITHVPGCGVKNAADLQVSKVATPSFTRTYNWTISKDVDNTKIVQNGGNATFNYSVTASETAFTDSGWAASGTITVTNTNNWEDLTTTVTDAVDNGGTCTITDANGGVNEVVPASNSIEVPYTCTYASAPDPDAGTNTATATWDAIGAGTVDSSATGTAGVDFSSTTPTTVDQTVDVTDSYAGDFGTLTATDDPSNLTSETFTYSRTVPVPETGCQTYDNTATIVETGQTSSDEVQVCAPPSNKTGALTIGYWQNPNGQGIISADGTTGGVCNVATWLEQFAPFQDLAANADCATTAAYVSTVIGAATCGGSTCNAQLKAQMLATALDVYFSDPSLGGDQIGAPNPIGAVTIDLTTIGGSEDDSAAFGGSTSLTILQMLSYAAGQSDAGGVTWYGNVKATQVLAKDAFDAVNNENANVI
jgi:hypothetical protein